MPFKIYVDFESLLERVRGSDKKHNTLQYTLENFRKAFLTVLLTKLFVLMINLESQLFFTEEKMQFIDSLKQFLKSMIITKNVLIKVLSCLEKINKDFSHAISPGYVINYLM